MPNFHCERRARLVSICDGCEALKRQYLLDHEPTKHPIADSDPVLETIPFPAMPGPGAFARCEYLETSNEAAASVNTDGLYALILKTLCDHGCMTPLQVSEMTGVGSRPLARDSARWQTS